LQKATYKDAKFVSVTEVWYKLTKLLILISESRGVKLSWAGLEAGYDILMVLPVGREIDIVM
jgi:hypothetical protein